LGISVTLHELAFQAKPEPEKLTTVPFVPDVGVTEMAAVTLKIAHAPIGTSFTGVPFTVTFHLTFVVASGPTTKLPVAICELMVHVGDWSSREFGP
jgi:hypothetical protein